MSPSSSTTAALVLGLLGSSTAHVIMNRPVPYGYNKAPFVAVNPLDSATYKFPCQAGHVSFDRGTPTEVTAGGSQLVNFTGQAVHGGGSCQFSVNYDKVPSPDPARWKVIYTILGGCPAKVVSTPGNLEQEPFMAAPDKDQRPDAVHCTSSNQADCLRSFDIPIPAGLPSGDAHFAWTWFNKIGNREMYMNCAPINIKSQSAAGDTAFLDKLPGLFVANVAGFASSNCTGTAPNTVINIPNPGEFGALMEDFTPNPQETCQAPGSQLPNFPKSMGGAAQATDKKPDSTAAAAATPTVFVTAPTATTPTAFVTAPTAAAPTTFVTVTSPPPAATAPTATPAPTGSSSSGGGGANSIACAKDGMLVCGGSPALWGLCDHGKAVLRPVAAGTQCVNNEIVLAGAGAKRRSLGKARAS